MQPSSLLSSIGKTPLLRLASLTRGLEAEVLLKIEARNPGFSVKDRAALAMIEGAEQRGLLRPGGGLVEPTSGNTGIGLAIVCCQKGYSLTLTMPESMSRERRVLLEAFGANLVLTPAAKGMAGAVEAAQRLVAEEGRLMLDQFANPDNAAAHYRGTGPELVDALGHVDIFVAGVGTGGTITGVGRYLREHCPGVRLVAVEPAESPLLSKGKAGPHLIQGIGANFIPPLLDQSLLDEVITVPGQDALVMGRRLAREEGLLAGISGGANVYAALLLAARPENKGRRIVSVLPDTGERYLSTALFTA